MYRIRIVEVYATAKLVSILTVVQSTVGGDRYVEIGCVGLRKERKWEEEGHVYDVTVGVQ